METVSILLALCGFPSQSASNAGFDGFFFMLSKQMVKPTVELPVIWDARILIVTSLLCLTDE